MSESSPHILKQVPSFTTRSLFSVRPPFYEPKPVSNLCQHFYFNLKEDHVPEQQTIHMEQIRTELGMKSKERGQAQLAHTCNPSNLGG